MYSEDVFLTAGSIKTGDVSRTYIVADASVAPKALISLFYGSLPDF